MEPRSGGIVIMSKARSAPCLRRCCELSNFPPGCKKLAKFINRLITSLNHLINQKGPASTLLTGQDLEGMALLVIGNSN